jgi:hypothetical protein
MTKETITMIDKRVITANHMNETEICEILLKTGVNAVMKQAGYIAPVNTEIAPITFGNNAFDEMHTYNQNMEVGKVYSMSPSLLKARWLRKVCGLDMPPAWSIMQYRMKFVLLQKRATKLA